MKVGIIGTGNIAHNMANTLIKMQDASLYAVASRSIEKAEAFATEYGNVKVYGSYEAMLNDKEAELIYIATPHSSHYECIKLCLEHGKNVLCEKPFTVNESQAKEVFEIAEEKKLFITEAIWTRYLPSCKMLQDICNSGIIGEIVSLEANLGFPLTHVERVIKPELAGGAMLDIGIYPLTFAFMILGSDYESFVTTATLNEYGVDSRNSTVLTYKDGKTATMHSTFLGSTNQLGTINGTKGYIESQNVINCEEIRVFDTNRRLVKKLDIPKQITGFEYQVRACQKALSQGKTECDEISHEQTLRVLRLMDKLRAEWGVVYPFEK